MKLSLDTKKTEPGKSTFVPLRRSLLYWLVPLALLPLIIVSYISYSQARTSLTEAAVNNLLVHSTGSAKYVKSWFDYRLMDLQLQSESSKNSEFLQSLISELDQLELTAAQYVASYEWQEAVELSQTDLMDVGQIYDSVYDIFLIDLKGNILFSVARKADLGSNLYSGPYAKSLFAESVRMTLSTGKIQFSDMEHYQPSNSSVSGFLSAPLLGEFGERIGVIAIRLRLERVFASLRSESSSNLQIYLVGADGVLRSPYQGDHEAILKKTISSGQFSSSQQELGIRKFQQSAEDSEVRIYRGPNGKQVIGINWNISLPGVEWTVFSEVDVDEALSSANWLARFTGLLTAVAAVLTLIAAVFQASRITDPIATLSTAVGKLALNESQQPIVVKSNNEIGLLASSFNSMLETRQRYVTQLQHSEEHAHQALVDLSEQKVALDQHAIVEITDLNGTITFVNDKFVEISGYSRQELIGSNHRILNSDHHAGMFWSEMYSKISTGAPWHGEIFNLSKSDAPYWVDTTIVPIKDAEGAIKNYISIRTDITQRKMTEADLLAAKEDAELAVRAKSEFLAVMSHEIRTPINGVLGMLRLLLNTELDKRQRRYSHLAQLSAQSLLALINDILDLSKVEAGKLKIESIHFDLRSCIEDFAQTMAFRTQEKDLELVLDTAGIEHSMVLGDPGRIRQILSNLVSNSIKFTAQGEIVIAASLTEVEGSMLFKCSVTDTGLGIPSNKISSLFDSFTQVDASTTRKFGGTGLGLAIVKQLCTLMGGEINVSSVPDRGSCFSFSLKLQSSNRSKPVIPKVNIASTTLLVVDDNTTNREMLRGQLEHWGATVREAVDGESTLELLEDRWKKREPLFDVAFLDMNMPGIDGAELGQKLLSDQRFSKIKLVMMTSSAQTEDVDYYRNLGFSAYFLKPATTSDIFNSLAVILESSDQACLDPPLVTHDYLQSFTDDDKILTRESNNWPVGTQLLMVEDNQINQEVALGVLHDMGLQADIAADGIEALKALRAAPKEHPYSLILMGCQMPHMDGYETTRQIRAGKAGESYRLIPILALVGDRQKCRDAGMSDYLTKPIDISEVYTRISALLQMGTAATTPRLVTHENPKPTVDNAMEDSVSDSQTSAPPIWNRETSLRRLGGKVERMALMIKMFKEEMPARITQLSSATHTRDFPNIQAIAHNINGVAATLGAEKLREVSLQLEESSMAKQGDYTSVLLTQLESVYRDTSNVFDQFIESQSEPEQESQLSLSAQQLQTLLRDLVEKQQSGLYISAPELEPLHRVFDDADIQRKVKHLLKQLGQYDNDGASQTIAELLNIIA